MGRLRQKGKYGAARAYLTRSAAVKKLQCSLADFRRLCILKGIFPREPRNRKKANKGSTAPTSFYFAKDIAYLAHEPVLKKLREHKAFAKKLSRALGRSEWSKAKSLEENKPVYRLDHIVKERYPTFTDALRDIDDALCMIFLFSSLPSDARLSPQLVENCARLSAEWQLYVMHSRSLRKAFLSIKGIYYQAEISGQDVTWLVPYPFTQIIPSDVDIRIMLTFLEFYQTLLGFVFFKLYTDAELAYPPTVDLKMDGNGAGVGAFCLQDFVSRAKNQSLDSPVKVEVGGKKVTGKDVRSIIKQISADPGTVDERQDFSENRLDREEEFIACPSSSGIEEPTLPTFQSLVNENQSSGTNLFKPYSFFLSRETPRSIFEFLVRCFGGRIGWHSSSGGGSPFEETDESITHVIIDRPVVSRNGETTEERERRARRKYVQPQWIVDCVNAGKILLEDNYAQGKALPPHLSPFGEGYDGSYDPMRDECKLSVADGDENSQSETESSILEDGKQVGQAAVGGEIARVVDDPANLRGAELAAELAGVDYGTFEKDVIKSRKASRLTELTTVDEEEKDMNKMMMSNKQRKLYERVKNSQRKRENEHARLSARKKSLLKERKKDDKSAMKNSTR